MGRYKRRRDRWRSSRSSVIGGGERYMLFHTCCGLTRRDGSRQSSTDRPMGFIQQKVDNTYKCRQADWARARAICCCHRRHGSDHWTQEPELSAPPGPAGIDMHPSHHLPAAGDVCGIYGAAQADEIVRARNASALRLLPSGRRRMSPRCVCGCMRPPDLHLCAHTVAIRSLWQAMHRSWTGVSL